MLGWVGSAASSVKSKDPDREASYTSLFLVVYKCILNCVEGLGEMIQQLRAP